MHHGQHTRRQIAQRKVIETDTGWKNGKIPPRHAPIFTATKRLASHWKWRSLRLRPEPADAAGFVLLIEASPAYGKWKALLLAEVGEGDWSCVARVEDQPGKTGLHAHATCDAEPRIGAVSLDHSTRWPAHDAPHRRQQAWTEASFFDTACAIYRIVEPPSEQPSLALDA